MPPAAKSDRAPPSLRRGLQAVERKLVGLPNSPGVYRMLDDKGIVLYVGKARRLRQRVRSYASARGHSNRIARMIALTRDMVFVRTKTESDALLLEVNLIKKFRPRFNVLMRDDKSLPYILLTQDEDTPRLIKHRGKKQRQGRYFGPFASAGSVNRTLNTMQRAFLLRSCSDAVYRTRSRPCLLYQIKRCSAPCTGEITPADYAGLVGEAQQFLNGKSQALQKQMSQRMQTASAAHDFETAAHWRDRLKALAHVQSGQGINPDFSEDADVMAIAMRDGRSCVQVFFCRAGQNLGNRAYFPRHDRSLDAAEILESFLGQFYDNRPAPSRILLNLSVDGQALIAAALSGREQRRVRVETPQRGSPRQLCQHAADNAAAALAQSAAQHMAQEQLLTELAQTFALPTQPERIEVYDNSHLQGSAQVGAMVVAGPQGFIKNQYRQFAIRDAATKPGDDYAMLREVLSRRFARLAPENRPDLILLDGGKGQLKIAQEVLREKEIKGIVCVAIAKGPNRNAGEEQFFQALPNGATPKPMRLPPGSSLLYYLQRLRDEAHRFAIGAHRARRKTQLHKNPLDEIDGIGATRKQALLHHFGSAKAVGAAPPKALAMVDGISNAIAERIHAHFHED